MDNIDVKYAQKKGKEVYNTPGASSSSVAELVFAHLFSISRFLHESNEDILNGETAFKSLKRNIQRYRAKGKKIGIIGLGKIGQEVAKIAIGLGMEIIAHDKFIEKCNLELKFYNHNKINFELEQLQ